MAEKARYYKKGIEGVRFMCKIFDEVREEGREEGKDEELLEIVRDMMRIKKMTAEEVLDILCVSTAKRNRCLKLIRA